MPGSQADDLTTCFRPPPNNNPRCFLPVHHNLQTIHHPVVRCSTQFRKKVFGKHRYSVARAMADGNEDPLADPVAVIITLQQYQKKLSTEVELLRQDVATSKAFQAKYGVRV